MGDLDINSIKNVSLRATAFEIDKLKSKDGKINTDEEWSVFNALKAHTEGWEEDAINELNSILGAHFSSARTTSPAARTTYTGVSSKEANKKVLEDLKTLVKDNEGFAFIQESLEESNKEGAYKTAVNSVIHVHDLINQKIDKNTSKKDLNNIKKSVEQELKAEKSGDELKFCKNVLNELIKVTKTDIIKRDGRKLIEQFIIAKKAADKNGEKFNYQAYMDQVKKTEKDKDALKELDEALKIDAFETVRLELDERNTPELKVSGKDLRKSVQAEYANDKYIKYATDKTENKTGSEIIARSKKAKAKSDELKSISREALIKAVGKDTFIKLEARYLGEHQNPDGTYDLTELWKEASDRAGGNYLFDRNDHDKTMDEKTLFNNTLNYLTKSVKGMDKTDTKDIIELCGFDIEGRDRSLKYIGNQMLGGLPEILGAAIGAAATRMGLIQVNATQSVKLNITNMASTEIEALKQQVVSQGGEFIADASGMVDISIEQVAKIVVDDRARNALISGASSLVIGAIAQGLAAAIFGGDRDEQSCISVSDYDKDNKRYKNPDDFKNYLRYNTKNPRKREMLNALIDCYVEAYGENWHEEFQNTVRKMAGFGSKCNPEECISKYYKSLGNDPVPTLKKEEEKPGDEATNDEESTATGSTECILTGTDTPEKDTTLTYTIKYGDSWPEIINAFYGDCLKDAAKEAGMKPTVYFKKALATDENGNLDQDLYRKLLDGYIPKTIDLPKFIGNCERIDNGKVKFVKPRGKMVGTINKAGHKSKQDGNATVTDCDKNTVTGKNKAEALKKYNEKYNKNYNQDDVIWN